MNRHIRNLTLSTGRGLVDHDFRVRKRHALALGTCAKQERTHILNIIDETCAHLARTNIKTFGLLATEGTVRSGAYERFCTPYHLTCITPTKDEQAIISNIIYGQIKQNKPVDMDAFMRVANALCARGCERLVLGCTELSLLKKQGLSDELFVDSLDVLAYKTILACGKTPVGFPASFEETEVAR